jgi:hypothetical protein
MDGKQETPNHGANALLTLGLSLNHCMTYVKTQMWALGLQAAILSTILNEFLMFIKIRSQRVENERATTPIA